MRLSLSVCSFGRDVLELYEPDDWTQSKNLAAENPASSQNCSGGPTRSPDYGTKGNEFSGEVNWVQIDLEKDDHDHLVTPEERFKVAMARQ